jgi:hypothetical protein
MKIEALHVGMKVRHIQYGIGVVKSISEFTADVKFDVGTHKLDPETSGIEPADPMATFTGLEVPLQHLIEQIVLSTVEGLGIEKPDSIVEKLGLRWHGGKMVLHPSDPTLSTKEVPLEVFFHKLVGVRNQLRVLEQKINAHTTLTDGEKVEMQQYITRCYGALTTFNLLFKEKEDQF